MSLRSFDVVVFGATGTIGELICKYIHRNQLFTKWAILGRSHKKLSILMNELVEMGGTIFPDILIADAQDVRNLRDIFLETRLLLNCLAPISLYRDIIEACLMARCDYIDLCSDVNFIQQCFIEFQLEAFKKGVCIMHGFSFEGAIADLGVALARTVSGNGACQLVESFLKINAPEGYTHRLLIDGIMSHSKNSKAIKANRTKIDEKFRTPIIKHPGAKVDIKTPSYFDERIKTFATPSLGTEKFLVPFSILQNCLLYQQTTQPQYHAYLASDNYMSVTGVAMHSAMLQSLSGYTLGRSVVRTFPEYLTEGMMNRRFPSKEQIEATSFEMVFISKGFMKTVETPHESEMEDSRARSVSDISDAESTSQFSRRGYVMTADQSPVDTNIGTLPCTFFTRPRSRSRYIMTEATMNTTVVKWIRVSGPDPYYTTTAILACRLMQLYLIHKRDQASLVNKTLPIGGVFTASNVFQKLPMVYDHLSDCGIDFHITTEAEIEAVDGDVKDTAKFSQKPVDAPREITSAPVKPREDVVAASPAEGVIPASSVAVAVVDTGNSV